MSDILDEIVTSTAERVGRHKRKISLTDLRSAPLFERKCHPLAVALQRAEMNIIAEIKKASPSAGNINPGNPPEAIAQVYEEAGASAISVLTEPNYFSGSMADLAAVRNHVNVPVLRKDFIVDEYQVFEAKAYGADAILLIARILEKEELADLHAAALSLGLDVLVELYDESEVDLVDFSRVRIVGANNRDLATMTVDINRSIQILSHVPATKIRVSESGVTHRSQLQSLVDNGIHAALVGESLMTAENPHAFLNSLIAGIAPTVMPS